MPPAPLASVAQLKCSLVGSGAGPTTAGPTGGPISSPGGCGGADTPPLLLSPRSWPTAKERGGQRGLVLLSLVACSQGRPLPLLHSDLPTGLTTCGKPRVCYPSPACPGLWQLVGLRPLWIFSMTWICPVTGDLRAPGFAPSAGDVTCSPRQHRDLTGSREPPNALVRLYFQPTHP